VSPRSHLLPFVLGLAFGVLGPGPAARAADKWVEVETPNFLVVSNAGEGTAQKTGWEFEQVRAAYVQLWPWAKIAGGKRTVVLALKDRGTMKAFAPQYYEGRDRIDLASVSAYGGGREFLLIRTDSRPQYPEVTPSFTLYRSYLSSLLSRSLERPLPYCVWTGLVEAFGNTSVQDQEIAVGRPLPWHVQQFADGQRFPLAALLGADRTSPLVRDPDQRRMTDAQCWTLVHYLAFGDRGAHLERLNRFLQLWLDGRPVADASREALGDLAALEREVTLYNRRSLVSYGRLRVGVALEREKLAARGLPPAEQLGLQASVLVAMERPIEALAALQQARAADPQSPASYDAEGQLADLEKDEGRAAAAYAKAAELGSTSGHTFYRAAVLAWKPDADAAARAAVRQKLERAVTWDPSDAYAQAFLADVLVDQEEAAAALAPARRAVALEPGTADLRVSLARVLHELGRDDEARAQAERALALDPQSEAARRFLRFLAEAAARPRPR
jgi:tetratricopeptide (TPR) repeat protein